MKMLYPTLLTAFTIGSAVAQRVVPINIQRSEHQTSPLNRRATVTQNLLNNITGGSYYADVSVGTPPQKQSLILDTGSSDVWLVAKNASLCSSQLQQFLYGYCLATFDATASSSSHLVSQNSFSIRYADGSNSTGNYIKDDFHLGGITIPQLQMGLGIKTTVPSGIMGIGYSANVASRDDYPNIMDVFLSAGLISAKAYSLYLNDYASSTGTILFGGIDTEKYIGQLKTLDTQADARTKEITSFTVALTSLNVNLEGKRVAALQAPLPVILDSGTTLSYLDSSIVNQIYKAVNAYDDSQGEYGTGAIFVDCKYLRQNITLTFQFGSTTGPVIAVPVDEVIFDNVKPLQELGLELPADLPFTDVCTLGIMASERVYLLGDTFLRSAYVVYDLANNQVSMAQANLNSTRSNVVEIPAGASSIPDATGVAGQVSVTQTATQLPGVGSTGAAGTGTGTGTGTGSTSPTGTTGASGTASSSGSAGARSVPAPDWQAVGVAALTGVGVIMGSLLMVL